MDRADLAQDKDRWGALEKAVINFPVSIKWRKFLTSWEPVRFSRRALLHDINTCSSETAEQPYYPKRCNNREALHLSLLFLLCRTKSFSGTQSKITYCSGCNLLCQWHSCSCSCSCSYVLKPEAGPIWHAGCLLNRVYSLNAKLKLITIKTYL